MQPTECEVCGGEVEFRREGSTQGLYCKNCDWALVTTYIPKIDLDETIYRIRITESDFHDENQVRAVATISGVNFIAARKLLQEKNPIVLEGEASKVKQAKQRLIDAGLRFEIFPEFNYPDALG